MHATILWHFGQQRRWTLTELATAMNASRDVVRRKLALWLNRGFIHEAEGGAGGDPAYEAATSLGSGEAPRHVTEDEEDGAGAEAKAKQLEDEMKVYEQRRGRWHASAPRGAACPAGALVLPLHIGHSRVTSAHRYVVGMLTNLESLPLDRIHNMLKMFVQSDNGDGGATATRPHACRRPEAHHSCPCLRGTEIDLLCPMRARHCGDVLIMGYHARAGASSGIRRLHPLCSCCTSIPCSILFQSSMAL